MDFPRQQNYGEAYYIEPGTGEKIYYTPFEYTGYDKQADTANVFWSNPSVWGAIQSGGAVGNAVTITIVLANTEVTVPVVIMALLLYAVSADQFVHGLNTAISNQHTDTALNRALQGMGYSPTTSAVIEVIAAAGLPSITVGMAQAATNTALVNRLTQVATQLPDSDIFVLGKYEGSLPSSYTSVAKDFNATYYSLSNWDEVAGVMGESKMWSINEKFLESQVAMRKTAVLSHNPSTATGSFLKEVNYLLSKGYTFEAYDDLWRAIPPTL